MRTTSKSWVVAVLFIGVALSIPTVIIELAYALDNCETAQGVYVRNCLLFKGKSQCEDQFHLLYAECGTER